MGRVATGNIFPAFLIGLSTLAMSSCVGGNTYGTGVTQEQQLLKDLEGMVTFGTKKKKSRVDHTARPDLVMPPQTAALPNPLEQESSTSNVSWPESPERKLARIRGEAEQADPRSGEISLEEQKRIKDGIAISKRTKNKYDIDKDGHAAIDALNDDSNKQVELLKEKYAYSNGPARKYLTEPPVEYRTPIETAPSGDIGISQEERNRRAERVAEIKKQNDRGLWTD